MDRVDELVGSPIGALLLDSLESGDGDAASAWRFHRGPLTAADPERLSAAVQLLGSVPAPELLALLVHNGGDIGPWTGGELLLKGRVLELAEQRRDLAEAVVRRSEADGWHQPLAEKQWMFLDGLPADVFDERGRALRGTTFSDVCNPPPLDGGSDAILLTAIPTNWDFLGGPVTAWELEVDPNARAYEIDGPADWLELVAQYPSKVGWFRQRYQWETGTDPRFLQSADSAIGRAVYVGDKPVRQPAWQDVAKDYDVVHLTWWGFVTCEGTVFELDDAVTMLREWGSERSCWLRPLLRNPRPVEHPYFSRLPEGADPNNRDSRTHEQEARWFERTFGGRPRQSLG